MKAGLPQLDPTWYPSQLFWLAATFVVLYLCVARSLAPRIGGVLENRDARLKSDLDQAAEMQSQAAKAQADYELSLKSARADAQKMLVEVTTSIKVKTEEKNRELDVSLASKIADSDKQIAAATQKAMASLQPAAAEVSAKVIEILLSKPADAKAVSAAVAVHSKEWMVS